MKAVEMMMRLQCRILLKMVKRSALLAGFLMISCSVILASSRPEASGQRSVRRDLSDEIRRQLSNSNLWLKYPVSTRRFYEQKNYSEQWLTPQRQNKTWSAMLLLDCVLQFGLSYNDYSYNDHLPSTLHDFLEKPGRVSQARQARFEIMLTDDIITFLNQLHFGVLNPSFAPGDIDSVCTGFRAEAVLTAAMKQNEFMKAVTEVQPKSKEYERLQEYLSSSVRYLDNCYELPAGELQTVAMNMERLRWARIEQEYYLLVNIPSYNLKYYADTVSEFKVVVGTPATPTPSLTSEITSFITGPDNKVPHNVFITQLLPKALKDSNYLKNNHYTIYDANGRYVKADHQMVASAMKISSGYYARHSVGCDEALGSIAFHFTNLYEISMHDSPDRTTFERKERALSNGGIGIENADSLAASILKNEGDMVKVGAMHKAVASYKRQIFKLKKVIPLKVVYLTCEILNGKLVTYRDIYHLDSSLQSIMFPATRPVSMR